MRKLLLLSVLLTATNTASGAKSAPPPPKYPANVGVQLYSVRNQIKADLPGTLKRIRQMGFRDVELFDFHGKTAAELRALLDRAGLRARSMHQPWERFKNDIPGVIADAKTLGLSYIGCSWIPHKGPYTAEANNEAIAVFGKAGKALAAAGVSFMYHIHGFEFAPAAGGSTLLDEMIAKTQPGVVNFEMDVFWVVTPGFDPVAYLKKYPDRFVLTHLKDMKKGTPTGPGTKIPDDDTNVAAGTGQIDIAGVVREANRSGKVAWHFLEDESDRSLEQLPASLAYLKKL